MLSEVIAINPFPRATKSRLKPVAKRAAELMKKGFPDTTCTCARKVSPHLPSCALEVTWTNCRELALEEAAQPVDFDGPGGAA